MIRYTLIATLFALTLEVGAQGLQIENAKAYDWALSLSERGEYEKSIDFFTQVLNKEPDNINILYNLGISYLNTDKGTGNAATYFAKAIALLDQEAYNTKMGKDLFMSLARTNQLQYKFTDAIANYNKMLEFVDDDQTSLIKKIQREITICNNAIELKKNPVNINIYNLGNKINTPYDEHSPIVNMDESVLYFTSRKSNPYSQKLNDGQYAEKIYYSKKTDDHWNISRIINPIARRESHETVVCLSEDGKELYLLISDSDGRDLYVSNYVGRTWSAPEKLPDGINSRSNETHASINKDKTILYFTSDREGGYGGLDIYMVRKLPNGLWGIPKNLGPQINTEYDEETPTIATDNNTLYFSSKGHNTMGDFDIFYSIQNTDESWQKPVNVGYPINTPDDNLFYTQTSDSHKFYYASKRDDSLGGSDIYLIEYPRPYEKTLALLRGLIHSTDGQAIANAEIKVFNKTNGQLEGTYRPSANNGKFICIVPSGNIYQMEVKMTGFKTVLDEFSVPVQNSYDQTKTAFDLKEIVLEPEN
jgi:Tol biopolymer transport system component